MRDETNVIFLNFMSNLRNFVFQVLSRLLLMTVKIRRIVLLMEQMFVRIISNGRKKIVRKLVIIVLCQHVLLKQVRGDNSLHNVNLDSYCYWLWM
jgi:hypothetical protein